MLTVALNYWLIPTYGLTGAAVATLLSLSLYNLLKYLFIWWQFQMQAFTWSTLKVLLIGSLAYLIASVLPRSPWLLLNLTVISVVFSLLFWGPVLYWRLSPDLMEWLDTSWAKWQAWLRRSKPKTEDSPLDE